MSGPQKSDERDAEDELARIRRPIYCDYLDAQHSQWMNSSPRHAAAIERP
jgi:hypothetical protein